MISARTAATAAAVALLAACAAQPPAPPETEQTEPRPLIDYAALKDARQVPATLWEEAFAPAEAALARGDWMAAELALPKLAPSSSTADAETAAGGGPFPEQGVQTEPGTGAGAALQPEADPEFETLTLYVEAYIDFLRGNMEQMQAHLQPAVALARTRVLPDAIARRVFALALRQQELAEDHAAAAGTRCHLLEHLGDDAERRAMARALWLDLQQLPAAQLRRLERSAADARCAGWAARARVGRGEGALTQWQQRFPEHPAEDLLPDGVGEPPAAQAGPQRITLLLPLSGRIAAAGAAVRDGFMAAYFSAPAPRREALELGIIDTSSFSDAGAAYEEALRRGTDLVIGPLTKQGVDELLARNALPVPVITLNRTTEETAGPQGSTQFALAPADEARQIARRALAAGHRRALLLRPAGDWGNRMERAVREVWEANGGSIAARATYADRSSHSESIKAALGLGLSEQRARSVRRLLGERMQTGSRRRQDLDVVLMLAPGTADAKSLGPLLAYHYAGDLPRFATSAANSAEVSTADRDLEDLQIVEMPWLLPTAAADGSTQARSLRQTLKSAALEPGARLSRLQALGVDAFELAVAGAPPGPWSVLRGVTGVLRSNAQRQLERELVLGEFAGSGLRAQALD